MVSTPGITTLIYLAISPSLPLAKNISYKLNGSKRFHRVIRVFSYDGIFFFDIFVELLSSLLFASSLFFHPTYPTHPCDRRVFVEESLRLIKRKKKPNERVLFPSIVAEPYQATNKRRRPGWTFGRRILFLRAIGWQGGNALHEPRIQ